MDELPVPLPEAAFMKKLRVFLSLSFGRYNGNQFGRKKSGPGRFFFNQAPGPGRAFHTAAAFRYFQQGAAGDQNSRGFRHGPDKRPVRDPENPPLLARPENASPPTKGFYCLKIAGKNCRRRFFVQTFRHIPCPPLVSPRQVSCSYFDHARARSHA